jgi:hypothetical protein
VCVCARACVRACVRVRACVCVRACVPACLRARARARRMGCVKYGLGEPGCVGRCGGYFMLALQEAEGHLTQQLTKPAGTPHTVPAAVGAATG